MNKPRGLQFFVTFILIDAGELYYIHSPAISSVPYFM